VPLGQIFKIYSSLPLSGPDANHSAAVVNAVNLVIDQQTEGGTLCDGVLKIEYQALDNTTDAGTVDPLREQDNAYQINADADAMAVIGPLDSDTARVSVPILNQGSVVMVSPSAVDVGLTKPYAPSEPLVYYPTGKRSFMRLVPTLDLQGSAAAAWARSLGMSKAFIVDDEEQYGRGPSDAFAQVAAQAGVQVVGRERIDAQASNLADIVTKLTRAGADLVYFGGANAQKAGVLLKQMNADSVQARFMGTQNIMAETFAEAAGEDALRQGAYATSAVIEDDRLPAKGQQFLKDYESRFNIQPEMAAIYGYEAASVVLAAAQQVCQKDRVALLDAMFATRNFDGVLGQWSFNANGDTNLIAISGNQFSNATWTSTGQLALP
jgi:branched-chain amino acid transport system substrate-binding protein